MKLTACSISKNYGKRVALVDFNIKVEQGEIVALLGPNGAGKTTSFYIITGIIPATTGTIKLDDVDITHFPLYMRARLGIGYLQQEASIFGKMTVEENLLVPLEEKYKNDKDMIKKKMEYLLDKFHIQHIRKSLGSVLSGGERRRVEVARILAIKPSFLLLDEPFAGVDPIAVNDIKNLILSLKKNNIGIIINDHNVRETLAIVDRAYILYNGKIICEGEPDAIVKNDIVKNVYLGKNF